jgi:DNA-binding XRE family transcriptional regulator
MQALLYLLPMVGFRKILLPVVSMSTALKKYREKHKLSQREVAESVGISTGAVGRIELADQGKLRVGPLLAIKIELALGGEVPFEDTCPSLRSVFDALLARKMEAGVCPICQHQHNKESFTQTRQPAPSRQASRK